MPAISKKQFRLFKAAENNPEFADKVGISQDVAKEFTKGNVGKKSYKNLKEQARRKAIANLRKKQ